MTAFYQHLRALLGGEYEAFIADAGRPPHHGLCVNPLKTTREALAAWLPYAAAPVPWCGAGLYYAAHERPAKSPAYHAGLFYIQEPSAMLPAALLDARPGDRVLDLCAAPGGKSAQIAGRLAGRGLLVANDASASRCRALVFNLERAGVTNAVVTAERPDRLAERFPAYFDRILVDAPCSGEGMFRRDADAQKAWTANKPEACARAQRPILRDAARMLRPGGRLVYSTCTFNTTENEAQIAAFLETHSDFALIPIDHAALGVSPGLAPLPETARVWPHRAAGEGHFAALLEKKSDAPADSPPAQARPLPAAAPSVFDAFCADNLRQPPRGRFALYRDSLYRLPDGLPDLSGLRVMRGGWYMGDITKGRFTPSQALAMGLSAENTRGYVDLTPSDALSYLKGNSFFPASAADVPAHDKPWALAGTQGHPLGWARWADGRLKNRLPTGWVMR